MMGLGLPGCDRSLHHGRCGGDGYRSRAWRAGLQRMADELRLPIHVSQFPRGEQVGPSNTVSSVTSPRTGGAAPS
jgi:hypothetical protein